MLVNVSRVVSHLNTCLFILHQKTNTSQDLVPIGGQKQRGGYKIRGLIELYTKKSTSKEKEEKNPEINIRFLKSNFGQFSIETNSCLFLY